MQDRGNTRSLESDHKDLGFLVVMSFQCSNFRVHVGENGSDSSLFGDWRCQWEV